MLDRVRRTHIVNKSVFTDDQQMSKGGLRGLEGWRGVRQASVWRQEDSETGEGSATVG